MNANTRFYALVAVIIIVVAGALWMALRTSPTDSPESTAEPTTPQIVTQREDTNAITPAAPDEASPRPTDGPQPIARPGNTKQTGKKPKRGNGSIRGKVVQAQGGQAAGGVRVTAELQMWRLGQAPGQRGATWETVANEEGEFRLDNLPTPRRSGNERVSYVVTAEQDDAFALAETHLSTTYLVGEVTLELKQGSSISGRIVDEAGAAVAGARVFPHVQRDMRRGFSAATANVLQVASDEEGAFTLAHLSQGEWKLTVKAKAYAAYISDFFPAGATGVEFVLSKGGSASGHVLVLDTKAPVPGATVSIRSTNNLRNVQSATTDKEGRFGVTELADSSYQVSLEDESWVIAGQTRDFTIEQSRSVDGLEFLAATGGVVSGRVYDQDTESPIAGVTIQAQPQSSPASHRIATSGADGAYRIEGLNPGTYALIRETKQGYPRPDHRDRQMIAADVGKKIAGIDFPIRKGLPLSGRVTDTAGQPLGQVQVGGSVTDQQYSRQSAQTKDDGTFEHTGYAFGDQVTLNTRKTGYSAEPYGPLTIGEEGLSGVEIVMEPGASIAGIVVDTRGKPLPAMYVNANPENNDHNQMRRANTQDDGTFKVESLAPGTYTMYVSPQNAYGRSRPTKAQEVRVGKAQAVTGIRLVYDEQQGLSIAGRVTNKAGDPVATAYVNAHSKLGGNSYGYTQTDADGRYEVKGLQEGTHRMYVSHGNYSSLRAVEAEAGSKRADFVLEGRGAVEGRVVDARTGQPIARFKLTHLRGTSQRLQSWMNPRFVSFHDEKGQFRLEGVEAGDNTVFAQAQGYGPGIQQVTGLLEGATVSGVEFRLSAGGVLEGKVMDVAGQPVSGAQIHLSASVQTWQRDRGGAALTDRKGAFRLDSLGLDTEAITVYHRAYAMKTVAVELAAGRVTPVEIVLGEGGQVEGTVRRGNQPLAGTYVSLRYTDQSNQSRTYAHTNAQGFYSIKGLPAGTAVVYAQVYRNNGTSQGNTEKSALVEEGHVTTVDFNLAGGTAVIEGAIRCDGVVPPRARISAMVSSEGSLPEIFSGSMDAQGNYQITGLPGGPVTLEVVATVSENEQLERSVQVEAIDGQTVRQDIQLTHGGRVVGSIAGFEQGRSGFIVALKGEVKIQQITADAFAKYQALFATAPTPISGETYKLSGLEPGTYTVVALAMGEDPTDLTSASFTTAVVTIAKPGEEVQADLTIP